MSAKFQMYCLGFLFDDNGHYAVLIEKNKPEWQKGKLNGVGGKIEEEETPVEAMRREFQEETGLRIENWERYAVMSGEDWMVHVFRAFTGDVTQVRSMTDERVTYVDVRDLFFFAGFPAVANLSWLIPLALDRGSAEGGHPPVLTSVRYP